MTAFRLADMIEAFQLVLDTPKCNVFIEHREVAKRSAANWHHGSFTPLTVCQSRPHCLRRFYHARTCDWTGVPLFSLWVIAKSEAIRYFQSVMNEITPFHRSLLLNRSWRTAAHAYAHHNHKEEVFDEWIFGCQGSLPFSPHKAKQVEGI